MFARIMHYYHQAKWIQMGFNIIGMVLGIYLIIGSYTFFQGIQGHPSGILAFISGLLFLCCGVLSILSRSITVKITGAIFAIAGLVVFLIA